MRSLATQQKFDKLIPVVFGNAEYNAERELLIAIDEIIDQSDIKKTVIEYFIDAAIRCDRKALRIGKFTWASVYCRTTCGFLLD